MKVIKEIVTRLFKSKVVLATVLGAIAKIVLEVFAKDIQPFMDRVVELLWALWVVFSAANNPTTPDEF